MPRKTIEAARGPCRRTVVAGLAALGLRNLGCERAHAAIGSDPDAPVRLAMALAEAGHGADLGALAPDLFPAAESGPTPIEGLQPVVTDPQFAGTTRLLAVSADGDIRDARSDGGGFRLALDPDPEGAAFEFLGATAFRLRSAGQVFGAMARALAIRTADPRGEQMPVFRAVWIDVRSGTGGATLSGVFDSPSAAGSIRFRLASGPPAEARVRTVVVPREPVASIGLTPLSATFLHAAGEGRSRDDWRPSVHDARGLLMMSGRGERLFRTFTNPGALQISAFTDRDPLAFGFVQRERRFDAFSDERAHFERRPSLLVRPDGAWGPGWVVLVEIPTQSEVNDNVIAFWQPEVPLAAGRAHRFDYVLSTMDEPAPDPPPFVLEAVRSGVGPDGPDTREFVLDYRSTGSSGIAARARPRASAWISAGTVEAADPVGLPGGRLRTRLVARRPSADPVELRADLYFDGMPPAEVWLHRWA